MRDIQVRRSMRASAERVFDVLADHEGYTRFAMVKQAVLLREGTSERNGLGAVRKVTVKAGLWFEEEITAFERPRMFEYRIRASLLPLEHELGRITVEAKGDHLEVVWASRLRVDVPLVGGLLGMIAQAQMSRDFARALEQVEALATS